ncbi:DUF2326 domain-containing protein [Saccharibacillus sp. CPCC 101409]|uniref:DUF2326 domain-containing protein n=1 Tax=Saccharibacillus sp. CPCC 101409 TaxID=3058041 RepID=UPI0026730E46|nr:DUF2326 domain-containing protein [Saccharibacillus sp. CPCC 101409]MDO3412580.1 DUF2326 domain-containing protein [Saccharibacillus sp. CPCC 101409]
MLYEIICNKFKEKRIEFLPYLNTVLGDDVGSNSIGKSTFLLIIDFVFGGKDYVLKSTEIQRNIGSHVIKFCFEFNEQKYFFSRDTTELELVNVCNERYAPVRTITLLEYYELLKRNYEINIPGISFREVVGRFSRVYGKDNLNEKRPLDVSQKERAGAPINALLKLFNLYNEISELEDLFKKVESELKAYKDAQKYNLISSIGVRTYRANEKELSQLEKDKEKMATQLDNNLLDMDSVKTEEVLKLKQQLSVIRRQRSRYYSQITSIENNLKENSSIKSKQLEELLKFFPEADTRRLEEIENFHFEIKSILKSELKEKKESLNALLTVSESEIKTIENKIKDIIQTPTLSKTVLATYSNLQKRSEAIERENLAYLKLDNLITSKKDTKSRRDQMKQEQLKKLECLLNDKMQEVNDYIYSGKKKAPTINFHGTTYTFETVDDTGTGTSYKNMVVYDISVLELSELPILIHDSVVLKQIADEAIEKILNKYESIGKQIFISFDKKTAYTNKSQEILKRTCILELSPNGNELFGRSWNNK